ncbi:MAG: DinB family protein [Gemmatimonadales bacterium]
MRPSLLVLALGSCLLAQAAAAQSAPVSDAFRKGEERASRHLVAAAEEMPAAKYGYKPTPAQMSFADVFHHLAEGNDFLCAQIGGATAPKRDEVKPAAGKDKLVARLKETFDFCATALAKVNDSDLGGKVKLFGPRDFTRAEAMFITVDDWADHYGQLANYLRLNGQLPPTAKEKEE